MPRTGRIFIYVCSSDTAPAHGKLPVPDVPGCPRDTLLRACGISFLRHMHRRLHAPFRLLPAALLCCRIPSGGAAACVTAGLFLAPKWASYKSPVSGSKVGFVYGYRFWRQSGQLPERKKAGTPRRSHAHQGLFFKARMRRCPPFSLSAVSRVPAASSVLGAAGGWEQRRALRTFFLKKKKPQLPGRVPFCCGFPHAPVPAAPVTCMRRFCCKLPLPARSP